MEILNLQANVMLIKTFDNPISKIILKVLSGGTVYVKDTTVTVEGSNSFAINVGERTTIEFWDVSVLNFISSEDSVIEYEVESEFELTKYVTIGATETIVDFEETIKNVLIQNTSSTATIYLAVNREAEAKGTGTIPLMPKGVLECFDEGCRFLHLISDTEGTEVSIKVSKESR